MSLHRLFIGLLISLFCLSAHPASAQSAWLANHFMAKKITLLPDGTPTISEYPVICTLSGPGPFYFDSCTQIITARGVHKFRIQLLEDATNKLVQMSKYTVNAAYDGYIDARVCSWKWKGKTSGWYRIEIVCDNGPQPPDIIGTFFFYVQAA
ncbi:MAG TPA: hypothetical protein DEA44_13845 [Firmicutes bacterium]|nr:hypothetical protein [Bacillota bacterium]HWR56028.1 hypothetical protein [Negativicutes bacterium]